MTTPSTAEDSRPVPSAVLSTKIDFLIEEFRLLRASAVPRGEYDAHRAADLARLTLIEAQLKQQGDRRWSMIMAVVGATLGVISSIVLAIIAVRP